MTEADVKQLAPQADRITITPDGTIGLKVGEFSQAVNVNYAKNKKSSERQIKDLYLDLMAMNREQDKQAKQAADEYRQLTR